MDQKLSNKGLWLLFVILVIAAISSFNYRSPCIPLYNPPSYINSEGVTVVDTTACQQTIPGINERILFLSKVISVSLLVAAVSILIWIFRRRKLNEFYTQNAVQTSSVNSGIGFVALIKYWVKPVLIGIVVIGLAILFMYFLWSVGLLQSER